MRRHLQLTLLVPVGDEAYAARSIWGQAAAEERKVLARLAAEFVLLHEAGSDQRVVIAPASVLEEAALPFAAPR